MRLPSKPTEYGGKKFRSQLESYWAIYWDKWGIRWLYESKRFDLGPCTYLPDFYLPDLGAYVEVKPKRANQLQLLKIAAVSRMMQCSSVMVSGNPLPSCQYWVYDKGQQVVNGSYQARALIAYWGLDKKDTGVLE